MRSLAAVALGGAIGATLRWFVGSIQDIDPGRWPWPTLFVNVVGCLLIGVAVNRIERRSLRWDAIVTGLLGGFTTMSSFAIELNDMVDLGRPGTAIAYGGATLASAAAALAVGIMMGHRRTEPPA